MYGIKPWEYGALRVSEDHRHLKNGDQPFFWLADTAWLLCQTTTEQEARIFLTNRRDKGFTVIQAVMLHTVPGEKESSLAAVSSNVLTKEYWDYCSRVVAIAQELGLYIALLPNWGSVVKEGFLNEDNIETFITYVADRFGGCPNVIWTLGGDIRGAGYEALYRKAGMLLRRLTPDKLICFHPFGRTSTSLWFHGEEWLDFNMFQSGHRDYNQASLGAWDDNAERETFFGEDNWRYVDRDLAMDPPKPTVDAEPSYEWILHGLHDLSQPYWREWDVRRYAYWSVFQGSMGHTYGHNSVQQMYCNSLKPGSYGAHWTWKDSMHHIGAEQMGVMRRLMESVDWQSGRAAEELLLSGQKERYHRISVFAGKDFLFAYDYLGEKFTINLTPWAGRKLSAWWFNPVSGCRSYFADLTGQTAAEVKPIARFTQDNDWVLVVLAE